MLATVLCIHSLMTHASHNRTNINQLTDPICLINAYLPHHERRKSRLINRRFNHYFNKVHSDVIQSMQNFTNYSKELIVDGIIKNATINALKTIYKKYKFNKYYLKKWLKVVGLCITQKSTSSNKSWMKNLMLLFNALNLRPWNKSTSLTSTSRLLVMMSHVIFDCLFFDQSNYLEFHFFLYETMWIYLSVKNSSFKLPRLERIYYLDENSEIYHQQISNLNTLHAEYGLIVWDPSMLHAKWDSDEFHAYITQFQHFKKLFNDSNEDFWIYLQIEFIMKLLERKEYNFGAFTAEDFEFYDFECMVRPTVHYLWKHRVWDTLDAVLLGLHDNNGLRLLDDDYFLISLCVDSNVTETFIGILIEHYEGIFPTWLAPTQAAVINITDKHAEYAKSVEDSLKNKGFRVISDLRNEKIGFKIRELTIQKVPYLLVVGDKEVESNQVAVRARRGEDLGSMDLDAFETLLTEDIARRGRIAVD